MDSNISQLGKKKNYTILLIGGTGVGKSCLKNRLIHKKYQIEGPTVGITSSNLKYTHKGRQLAFNVIDTAGQEQFKSISKSFYKDCFAVLFCFAGDSPKSLKEAEHYTRQFQVNYQNSKAPENFAPVCLFVRNKCDLPDNKFPEEQTNNIINSIAETYGEFKGYQNIKYFEASAMEGTNTEELLAYIVDELDKQKIFDLPDANGSVYIDGKNNEKNQQKKPDDKKCC